MNRVSKSRQLESAFEALRRSEQRFRALAEATASVVWTTDAEGRIVEEQPSWERYTGQSFEQYRGYGWHEAVHEDDRPGVRAHALVSEASGSRFAASGRLWHAASRSWRQFEARGVAITDPDGAVREWVGVLLDVHDEAEAKRALAESAERLELITEGVGIGTWDADLRRGVTFWSPAQFALYGLKPAADRLVSRDQWLERVHPDDRERAMSGFEYAMWHRLPFRSEYRVVRADTGEVRWVSAYARFVGPEDDPQRLIGLSFDITNRKSVELALRESEERYRLATQALRGYVYEWDAKSDRVRRSEGFEEMVGGELEGTAGEWWGGHVHSDDRTAVEQRFRAAVAGNDETLSLEYRVRRHDGEILWVWDHSVLVRDESGAVARVVGNIIDITARKRAEEHRELLIGELNHRVKNTLAIVQSLAAQTLRSTGTREEFGHAFNGRLAALAGAHDLLLREGWQRIDLETLLRRVLGAMASTGRLEIGGPRVTVSANAAVSLGMALHELATNAVKYGALSAPAGHVDLSWTIEAVPPAEERLTFHWQERGGPSIEPPAREGFGSRLVQQLGREFSADIRFDWQRLGLEVTFVVPAGEHWHRGSR